MLGIRTQPSLSRDFTLLSLFIVLILVIVSAWVTIETLNTHSDRVVNELEKEASRVDRAVAAEIEHGAYILESIAHQIQATGTTNTQATTQLLFSFAKNDGPQRVIYSWINANQQLILSSNLGVLAKSIDVSDRDYVKKSIAEPWKVHMGRPIMGRLSQKIILPLSIGIADTQGTYLGTIVAALDAELLTERINAVVKDPAIALAVTNLSLSLVTTSLASEKFFSENFNAHALSKIDFSNIMPAVAVRPSLFERDQMFTYYTRSAYYPLVIFVGMDAKHTALTIHDVLLPRLFQLLIITLFLLFVLWTVRKRIIHPVMQLTYRTAALTRGEPFTETPIAGPLEIEQLNYEIKRLYDYLEERRRVEGELRLKNAELTRVKEAAALTNKVKADFFAYVGQELTEPAETIHEQIDIIKDQLFGPIDNPKYLQHARDIHDQSQLLLEMLQDIKTIAAAETGILALDETEMDIGFILQKTIRIFRDTQVIDIQTDGLTNLPHIRGDDLRLKQLVLNVLNAIARHAAPGGVIRIASSSKSQDFSLHFSYQTPSVVEKQRTAASFSHPARTKYGLELAMARLLMGMHQGTLDVKTTQDRTTTITLKFPASRIV